MKTHVRRQILGTALMLGLAVPAAAQQDMSAEMPSRTPGWSVTPGFTFGTIYDSNVALASAPADTRRTQGDRMLLAEPFGQLEYFSPRTEFSSGYQGYLRRYADVTQLNSFDQRGYVSLRRLATRRLTFFLHESYADVPTTDEVELNGVPFSRTGSQMNVLAGGFEARVTKFTDLSFRYENEWVQFDRAEAFLTGGFVNGVRTELSHRLSNRLSVGGEYGLRFADLNEGVHHVSFQDAGGTLHVGLDPRTTVSVAGGWAFLNDQLLNAQRNGAYLRGEITHEARRATVGGSFERNFVPSFGFGGSNQSEQLRGFVRMPFDRNRLYVQASAAWRRSTPLIANELQLDTFWIRSTLGYSASRWLRLEGFHAFTRQDSQVTGGEINRHRIGAQVVVSQPVRIQ
jgi:hypothetical protein